MRYLMSGQWRLTLESVRERERLLVERPGLVEPQPFLMPLYAGSRPGPLALGAAFWIADRMAGRLRQAHVDVQPQLLCPARDLRPLAGRLAVGRRRVDDARLVLRLIFDAVGQGGRALNHVEATLVERRPCHRCAPRRLGSTAVAPK
jgi:glycerol-3-phosphate dehydrogenase